MSKKKYYIVSEDALPDIFIKVAEAKRMLQVGEAQTVGEAARLMNISRSAFYKYKDAVQPFQDMKAGRIITFYALLTIPTNGCAGVTISAETSDMKEGLDEMMAGISAAFGVLKFEVLAG